jgi:flavin-dependent dehydrogenase
MSEKSRMQFLSNIEKTFLTTPASKIKLRNGSSIAVVGGGPAGSFFSYFILNLAREIALNIKVDIYEPQNFFMAVPRGCNKCGGIISETLVQNLAMEGINIPPQIIQRGIESYTLHTDVGTVKIETPTDEKRIGAVHRGCGPKDLIESKWGSFDGFLQILALENGANLFQKKVEKIDFSEKHPQIIADGMIGRKYDLVAVATGVNSSRLMISNDPNPTNKPPETRRTMIREYFLGEDEVHGSLGDSMHIFLVNIPEIEFAAYIPKGEYVTFCMLGKDIDAKILKSFLSLPNVQQNLPPKIRENLTSCNCVPNINVNGITKPYHDRLVFIGDSGFTRLYKDGIGAAYRTAKSAATTAVLHGIAAEDFEQFYWPVCRSIEKDNKIGKLVFQIVRQIQNIKISRRAFVRMAQSETEPQNKQKIMSTVLWDMFTGSASYREIFMLTLTPLFIFRFAKYLFYSVIGIHQNGRN